MKLKSTKKYRHDMIQAWVHQKNNRWVEECFTIKPSEGKV